MSWYRLGKRVSVVAALLVCCLAGRADADPPAGAKWKRVWQDEFDGKDVDAAKWEKVGDWKRKGGFWSKADATLDGKGHLVLRTRKDGDRFTSGGVRSKGRFEHAFGYYEIRCKLPKQAGHWPAFWLFCDGVKKVGNAGRDGTEIDIMESPFRGREEINLALHWDGYGKEHRTEYKRVRVPGLDEGFHTFGLHWKRDEYVFYADGKEVWRTKAGGIAQVPNYVKITEEVGRWGGDIRKATLPDYFVVDYVRVYDVADD